MRVRWLLALPALLLAPQLAPAADPTPEQFLATTLRDLLLKNLPEPLVKSDRGWDRKREVVVGIKWPRDGKVELRPRVQKAVREDGHWQRVRVDAIDPAKTSALGVRDVKSPEPGRTTFEAMLGVDARVTWEQQLWKSGVRLYGGETRARFHAAVRLKCEATNRLEPKPGAVLPDAVIRVRVTEAELFYTDLVCEHTAGLDGKAAERLGKTFHNLLTDIKPSVEKDLLAKANAAVVKAADTREVRIGLDALLKGKPPTVTRATK